MAEKRLIEAVREHKLLYDTNDANYIKIKLKSHIWEDIAKALNFTDGEEAKTLWLKLRAGYRDARRRQAKYLKRGTAAKNIKPWRFQKKMSFLDPFMLAGSREGNINAESNEDSQELEQFVSTMSEKRYKPNVTNEEIEQSLVEDTTSNDEEPSSIKHNAISHISSSTPVAYSKQPKKSRPDDKNGCFEQRSIPLRENNERKQAGERRTLQANSGDDPLHNFFISMYQFTKTMPPDYQHRVRGQIFRAVSEAEGEILNVSHWPLSRLSSSSSQHSQQPQTSRQQFETVYKTESDITDPIE
ncbi:uncharacterized protein LOC129767564 [Toxorhynchites rutilus septentrionalis]|uniref:uncharacterized protein LOC129767564 n=1 Tax=Toxorhynchites rutilus septentrionalis TaxID=329112 RepID=UPI00247A1528|nr:uncharacterized protein LOC129767564 [Toxorhynchites rutilus septentrionalis]